MTPRRELLLALALQVLGGVAVLVAAARPWMRLHGVAELGVVTHLDTGVEMRPGIPALAWVALAAAVAVVATRGWLRAALGAAVVLVGLGLTAAALDWLLTAKVEGGLLSLVRGWAVVVVVAGLLVALGGALTLARGRSWSGMGSSYEAPAAKAQDPVGDKGVWDALDRGDDPTA